jgi:hypothetical protein
MMIKKKALRGVQSTDQTDPDTRRLLNDYAEDAQASSAPDVDGVAESEGLSWALTSAADIVEEKDEDAVSLNGVDEELTTNADGIVTNVTKAVSEGDGGGGGGGTGYAYSYNGGSSQGSGQGAGTGGGGGKVVHSDGTVSDGGGDGNGQGSGLAYSYSQPGGKSSSSGSGNGAGYGGGAASNAGDQADDVISGLSQNSDGDEGYEDDYDGYGGGDGWGGGGYGIAQAISEGTASASAFGGGKGGNGNGGGGPSQNMRPGGYGWSLNDADFTEGTYSQNSGGTDGKKNTKAQGFAEAGFDGIGIGIGLAIGPKGGNGNNGNNGNGNGNNGEDGDLDTDGTYDEDGNYVQTSTEGDTETTKIGSQAIQLVIDITS